MGKPEYKTKTGVELGLERMSKQVRWDVKALTLFSIHRVPTRTDYQRRKAKNCGNVPRKVEGGPKMV